MKKDNLICGRKPTFGDKEQIAKMLYHERIVNGKEPINSFQFFLPESHLEKQVIKAQFDCYDCKTVNYFEFNYDNNLSYQSIMTAQDNFKKIAKCSYCKHKYYYDDDDEFDGGLFYKKPR